MNARFNLSSNDRVIGLLDIFWAISLSRADSLSDPAVGSIHRTFVLATKLSTTG
jgi:hypothetical protein